MNQDERNREMTAQMRNMNTAKPTLTLAKINPAIESLAELTDILDRRQLARIQADLETLMLRHGRGRIIGICVEAIRSAEFRGQNGSGHHRRI